MSVASKNLFALLDEESQDAPAAPAPKQEDAPQTPPSGNKSQNQRGKGPASRGGRYYQRGGKQSTAAAAGEATEENANTESRKKRVDGDQRGRGRGARGARGRGRGGGRGREFDRHSGTLPDSEKRVHQGWGGDDGERELQNEQAAAADATGEVSGTAAVDWAGDGNAPGADWGDAAKNDQADDWSAAPAADASPAGENKEAGNEVRRRRQQEEEEDDNTVTFDQYLAQKKQATADLPKLEGIRKANEGSDDALWKNAVHNGKENEEENYFVGKTKAAPKSKAKKTEKEFIEIEARFERPQRGGRGGRGRGGGGDDRRGRGGRGGSRNNNRNTGGAQVDVADEAAFPSLS